MITTLPGHGAVERPQPLKVKDHIAGALPPFNWTTAPIDNGTPTSMAFGIPDEEQNSGLTCTSQAPGYGIHHVLEWDNSRHDSYCNTFLPGGGAYLNAPLDWYRQHGITLRSRLADPSPQTEPNMEAQNGLTDTDRVKNFTLSYEFLPATIDGAAQAIANYDFVILGIRGSWAKGWDGTWTDPSYEAQNDWQHALFAGEAVMRNGIKAIKCKSSWTQHQDLVGQPSYVHYINNIYFSNGGVFEIIGVTLKETTPIMSQIKVVLGADGHTVYKCEPIADMAELNDMASIEGFSVPNPIPPATTL